MSRSGGHTSGMDNVADTAMSNTEAGEKPPVTIKKYANRRLYNTATSSYVTLEHLCQMVKDGVDFVVFDAKTGEDITRAVLTQIIVEEEGKGQNLLPISFLRQLIAFYGDNMHQMLLPRYLDYSMQAFSRNQEKLTDYMNETFGGMFPFGQFEEMNKQNMAMFERAMSFFTPFGGQEGVKPGQPMPPAAAGDDRKAGSSDDQLADLRRQLEQMQSQIEEMEKSPKS